MKAKIFSVLMVVGVLTGGCCCWVRKPINSTVYVPPPVQEVGVTMPVYTPPPVAGPVVLFPPVPEQPQPMMMVLEKPQEQAPVPVQVVEPSLQPQVQFPPETGKERMLHLFCEQCNRYYTWKGGQLPEGTELFYWHPEDKEWQRYGGDYRTIMRQPPVPESGICPYHNTAFQVQLPPDQPTRKLMLHLFCEGCKKYYTWKGGQLPEGTELFYWHPEDKEWQRYGGDYRTIMRQPPVPESGICPYHRR